MKCQAGWLTNWNQDFREAYQQSLICRWHHFNGRNWRWTKEPRRWRKKRMNTWLKNQHSKNEHHGIQSHHFMANKWTKNENSDRFHFLGLKITADGDCSQEIKRPTSSLASFTFIKQLFSSSLSAIRVVSCAYLSYWYFSWQYWFQLVLPPAQRFSWCTLHIS